MKIIASIFLLVLSFTLTSSLNAQNHHNPQESFNDLILNLQNNKQTAQDQYNMAYQYFTQFGGNSYQLKKVCDLFPNDKTRYRLCMDVYQFINDKQNFFGVYDAFSSFSYALQLYHNTQANDMEKAPVALPVEECFTSANEFKYMTTAIEDNIDYDNKLKIAKSFVANNCLSMEQLKDIIRRLTFDSYKLDMIKYLYDYLSDPKKLYMFRDTLTSMISKQELDEFLASK